ncbi:MAG: UDP-N-acetylglucosamine 2-epimerase (non-hydrolyzing) [Rhodothermales bacterium]|nr:UDP-N-acetylglucosamine 2-epimerase (non-hydrolyzing) [Rhodothermales bacterium]MBO6779603.1 UDP-N-acetylglucosamine 2-epimerase (non-hydrolyzing) [Rhodothermales bacterium]
MTVLSVVGARPQFVKAAVVSRAIRDAGIREVLVHTGQHYDERMSRVFFDELGIPRPDVNLAVGSGSHAAQTGGMMTALEGLLQAGEKPDWVLVYGDTNSTIAAALVAAKLHVPLAHVEAGLRSFNRRMPEEINRVVTDRLSTLLYCPTRTAVDHLAAEGIRDGVLLSGDVMLDATRHFSALAEERVNLATLTDHAPGAYHVATVHRAENTDDPARLAAILDGLGRLKKPVLLPAHPRVRALLSSVPKNVLVREPATYLELLTLVRNADRVYTDSGGLQKEAVWLGRPCVTLRDETEWVETCEGGWNRVVGANADAMEAAETRDPDGDPPRFGLPEEGESGSEFIARTLA